ncbi:cupin domain-containing protein [Halorientalis pallida]|uniref:cupin domain-containing protein n=1 Tax=Halorientalis pallida TaxID=2479928 RepID=UPI003C6EEA45
MEYEVVDLDDVDEIEMAGIDQFPAGHKQLTAALGLEESHVNVWRYEPGDSTAFHAHREQEEVFYVLAGEFEVTLGDPEDPETRTIGPGTAYAAGPEVGHGHEYLGDDEGLVLAIGAPPVDDTFRDPETL